MSPYTDDQASQCAYDKREPGRRETFAASFAERIPQQRNQPIGKRKHRPHQKSDGEARRKGEHDHRRRQGCFPERTASGPACVTHIRLSIASIWTVALFAHHASASALPSAR